MSGWSLIALLLLPCGTAASPDALTWYLPIAASDRHSLRGVALTKIGRFGAERKARPGIPAHLHTGVDLCRPDTCYQRQPVFPAAQGVVVSMRDDGPFAQVIVCHGDVWTVYEHLTGIVVAPGDTVDPSVPIGRFFNRDELDSLGWQFDHMHFEVMVVAPPKAPPAEGLPHRLLGTYALVCFSRRQLISRLRDPLEFLHERFTEQARFPASP